MEAAKIYKRGWAPEVWLCQVEASEADAAFAELGISHPMEIEYNRQVLERLGAPKAAIRVLELPTTNTVSEIRGAAMELQQRGGEEVILVTSAEHTRRTRIFWRIITLVGAFRVGTPRLQRHRAIRA